MAATWCRLCCTDHHVKTPCPGELAVTGPEVEAWKVSAETPEGVSGFGVLLAPAGARWRARILTFPKTLWTTPGGEGTIKFVGRSAAEAERKASIFIREHCLARGYVMRDELELVEEPLRFERPQPRAAQRSATRPAARAQLAPQRPAPHPAAVPAIGRDRPVAPRYERRLPVSFGENMPTLRGSTVNLSSTGLFLQTKDPLTKGMLVGLMLELEHAKVPLRGSVAWLRRAAGPGRPSGMGLKLLNPPQIYTRYIHALA